MYLKFYFWESYKIKIKFIRLIYVLFFVAENLVWMDSSSVHERDETGNNLIKEYSVEEAV